MNFNLTHFIPTLCISAAFFLQTSFTENHKAESCFPTNNRSNPIVENLREGEATGISEEDFNVVLDEIETIYVPIFEELGKEFVINRLWTNNQVNATANQSGDVWKINMYGGLARDKNATIDAFRVVACHEIGHHLGGAPKKKSWWSGSAWASNEGQSDYYANFICMKKLVIEGEKLGLKIASADLSIYEDKEVNIAKQSCIDSFMPTTDLEEEAMAEASRNVEICTRSVLAGLSLGRLLGSDSVSLSTPDTKVVSSTNHSHPKAQCRADTYYNASLCNLDHNSVLDESDPNVGTCNRQDGFKVGLRSLCWFKPEVTTPAEEESNEDLIAAF